MQKHLVDNMELSTEYFVVIKKMVSNATYFPKFIYIYVIFQDLHTRYSVESLELSTENVWISGCLCG